MPTTICQLITVLQERPAVKDKDKQKALMQKSGELTAGLCDEFKHTIKNKSK